MNVIKNENKIFLLSVIILLLFLVFTADFKVSSLEYLCWVYYCFLIILAICILISSLFIGTSFQTSNKYIMYERKTLNFRLNNCMCGQKYFY